MKTVMNSRGETIPIEGRPSEEKRKTLQELIELAGARGKAVAALIEALDAERTYWDGDVKEMAREPDYKTRVTAAMGILAYSDGKPVERKEVINVNVDGDKAVEDRLIKSSALREALQRKLAQLESGEQELINTMPDSVKSLNQPRKKARARKVKAD